MNENELKRFRDYANHYQGSDVAILMEHIDTQAKQIEVYATNFDAAVKDYNDAIKQIAILKAAVLEDREELILYSPSYSVWRYQHDIESVESGEDWKPIVAKAREELARELPDIDWSDVE